MASFCEICKIFDCEEHMIEQSQVSGIWFYMLVNLKLANPDFNVFKAELS